MSRLATCSLKNANLSLQAWNKDETGEPYATETGTYGSGASCRELQMLLGNRQVSASGVTGN